MIKNFLLCILLIWTWAVCVFHLGVFTPPVALPVDPSHHQLWISKEKVGVNQIILTGNPYERGLAEGRFERDLLFKEETGLIEKLYEIFKTNFILKPLQVLMVRWFWGADRFFEDWAKQEMYGVSRSSSNKFNSLGNEYNRQLYYHGLHEVGQMMVDQKGDDMGCTVAAVPYANSWILGRNFDFEGGRVFDEDKIVKWVFPDQGNAYVSVIWAGMVGAVTGVNEKGLYISLNAAGAKDFRRYGTPTTLVLAKVLQFSENIDAALETLRSSETFITDIFMVADRDSGKLFRVEKSPHRTEVIELHQASIVANDLIADFWKNDPINTFRRNDLTSAARVQRGQALLNQMQSSATTDYRAIEQDILNILRDKGDEHGTRLHLGNRNAIDSLIATHSVIYNSPLNHLYVSNGPSLTGTFTGFDLSESFKNKSPSIIQGYPRDPLVTEQIYKDVKDSFTELTQADLLIKKHQCSDAEKLISSAKKHYKESYNYSMTLGNYNQCIGDIDQAKLQWHEALTRVPAYASERNYLKQHLESTSP